MSKDEVQRSRWTFYEVVSIRVKNRLFLVDYFKGMLYEHNHNMGMKCGDYLKE
jgi:hypothetical protein